MARTFIDLAIASNMDIRLLVKEMDTMSNVNMGLSLEDSGLSIRTINKLKGEGIKTLGDITRHSIVEVLKMAAIEIKDVLEHYDLSFRS